MFYKKLLTFWLFILSSNLVSAFNQFPLDHDSQKLEMYQKIGSKVVQLIDVGVPFGVQRIAVFIMFKNPDVQEAANVVVKKLAKKHDKCMFVATKILKSSTEQCRRCRSRFNIFFVENTSLDKVWEIIDATSFSSIFTLKFPTIFITIGSVKLNETRIENNFKKLFKKNLLNVFWIFLNTEDISVRSFDFNPFKDGDNLQEFDLFATNAINHNQFEKDSDVKGYTLRLVTYDDPPKSFSTTSNSLMGYEGLLLRLICEKINATPVIRVSHKRHSLLRESLELLMDNSADMTVNPLMFLSRDYSNSSIDFIYPHVLESINLLVPMKTEFSLSKESIFRPFSLKIWIVLLATIFGFTCLWFILKLKLFREEKTFISTFLEVLRVFTGGLTLHPIDSVPERFLFTGYILFVFLIMNGYQTALISILTTPEPKSYWTLADVNNSQDIHIVLQSKYEVQRHLTTKHLNKVLKNRIELEDVNLWDMWNLDHNHSHAYLAPKRDAEFLIKSVANRDLYGSQMYRLLPQGLLYSIETYAIRKNFVLKEKISSIMTRSRQAGLLDWLETVSFFQARQHGLLNNMDQRDGYEQVRVVTFDSLKSAFILLLVGYIISIVVFICEISFPWKGYEKIRLSANRVIQRTCCKVSSFFLSILDFLLISK